MEILIGVMNKVAFIEAMVYANAIVTVYILVRLLWKH